MHFLDSPVLYECGTVHVVPVFNDHLLVWTILAVVDKWPLHTVWVSMISIMNHQCECNFFSHTCFEKAILLHEEVLGAKQALVCSYESYLVFLIVILK